MKRRDFVRTTVAGGIAGAATAGFPKPSLAKGKLQLKMVTSWPKNFPGLGTGAERFARRINQMSEGRITVTVYAAGELVPAFEAFDAVSSGSADLYHSAEYYWIGKTRAFNFFTNMVAGTGMTPFEHSAWIYHMGGQKLWDELSANFNIKALMAGSTGTQMAGWANKEIKSLDDLKGFKFRIAGISGDVLRPLGVTVVNLPGGEIFQALQSGTIEGADWVGPWNDLAFGFYKVVKHYYWPSIDDPGPRIAVGFNKGVWDKFSASDKAMIEAAAAAENDVMYAEFLANNGPALDTLVNKHHVDVKPLPDDVYDAITKSAADVAAEIGNHDKLSKRIYQSWMKARNTMAPATDLAEKAIMDARARYLKKT